MQSNSTFSRNTKIGFVLFLIYLAYYAWFVLTNALDPTSMERATFIGLNRAVFHGFGLIVSAFILALLYGFICTSEAPAESLVENKLDKEDTAKAEDAQ